MRNITKFGALPEATTSSIVEFAQLPRRHFMPYEATPFDRSERLTYSVANVVTTILTLTLPSNSRGIIKSVGQGADTADISLVFGSGNTTWGLFVNGIPVIDWGSITLQRGTIQAPTSTTIDLPNGSIVTFRITSPDIGFRVYGRLTGWYWTDDTRKE